ncbi:MAG: hypothetical protein ACI4TX_02165 [Christensenellales bacterium]
MYIKRTLILSKLGYEDKKALATIQKSDDLPCLIAKFQEEMGEIFALVRYDNSPIEVVPLSKSDENSYNGVLPNFFDCSAEIYVAIIVAENNNVNPKYIGGGNQKRPVFYDEVLKNLQFYHTKCLSMLNKSCEDVHNCKGGNDLQKANQGCECISGVDFENESTLFNNESNLNALKNNEQQIYEENNLQNNENDKNESKANLFEMPSQEEVDDIITNTLLQECLTQKDKCENCIYKKAFYNKDSVNDYKDSECIYEDNEQVCENEKDMHISAKNVENLNEINNNMQLNYKECTQENGENDSVQVCESCEQSEDEDDGGNFENGEQYSEDELNDEATNENESENIENNSNFEKPKFYKQIENSLNSLFAVYPSDELLEERIDGSKFAKVDYENTGDYYSVGYISEDNVPKYICYAIPCKAGSPPPKNMEEFSQYLPIDNEKAYYLMYQNADNGETIEIIN